MLKTLVGILAAFGLLLTAHPAHGVINGEDATIWDGFTVGLHSTDRIEASKNKPGTKAFNSQFCGGALVSPIKVVTAAHCLVSRKNLKFKEIMLPEKLLVGYGIDLNHKNYTMVEVESIAVHPQYKNESVLHDIAIITLQKPVESSKPIKLNTQLTIKPKTKAVSLGWGGLGAEEYNYGENFPHKLQKAHVYITPKQTCGGEKMFKINNTRIYPLVNPELEANPGLTICAIGVTKTGEPIDSCGGDSGGPLVNQRTRTLLGITSWGYGCGGATPGAYVNVAAYLGYIHEHLTSNIGSVEKTKQSNNYT